ncbi:MAG: RAD55 family ATPase [Halarchaeum sp.]
MADDYDVGDVLPVESVPAGTNLLIGGPPMTGKAALALSLIADGCPRDEGAVVVTTRDDADRLLARTTALADAVAEGRAGIVDCVTRERGDDPRETTWKRYVSSPGDVTDVGIRTAGLLHALDERGVERVRAGFVSLSTMLMYVEPRRLFRFLHVYTGRVQAGDLLGLGVMQLGDREAFDTFAPLFDGMVQTRLNDGDDRELRVVGVVDSPTDWVRY